MSIQKQLIWSLIILLLSQAAGQVLPPFGMFIGTPIFVPIATIIICFLFGEKSTPFNFELKALVIIIITLLSAVLDYFYAPGTHDQVGFAWQSLFWSYGLFVLFYGLAGVKLYIDFSFAKAGLNLLTLLTVLELSVFIAIPLIYLQLLKSGQITAIIGNC